MSSICKPDKHRCDDWLARCSCLEVYIAHMKFTKTSSLSDKLDALLLEYVLPHAKRNTFYRKALEKNKKY